jgi:hypothetical protein
MGIVGTSQPLRLPMPVPRPLHHLGPALLRLCATAVWLRWRRTAAAPDLSSNLAPVRYGQILDLRLHLADGLLQP